MRLPLLVHASPSVSRTPCILLRAGTWKVESDLIDTELYVTITADDETQKYVGLKKGESWQVPKSPPRYEAQVVIMKAGTEKTISVDIVRIGD